VLPELTAEEFAAALESVAIEVLDAAGVQTPPVDVLEVARAMGITVAWDDRQRGRGRCVRLGGYRGGPPRPTILLRPEPRPERRHWATAHEIGEQVAHRVFSLLGVDPREAAPNTRESVANHLAGRLLLPGQWFAADARACGWDLFELKRRYASASHELIARRMLDFPPPVIITIYDQDALTLRRSNLPGRVPSLSEAERQCRQRVHEGNGPDRRRDGAGVIQAWPVHEDGWRREILRTEVDECC
jgi:Zn-dependent peptidase ImmA (M78 family)